MQLRFATFCFRTWRSFNKNLVVKTTGLRKETSWIWVQARISAGQEKASMQKHLYSLAYMNTPTTPNTPPACSHSVTSVTLLESSNGHTHPRGGTGMSSKDRTGYIHREVLSIFPLPLNPLDHILGSYLSVPLVQEGEEKVLRNSSARASWNGGSFVSIWYSVLRAPIFYSLSQPSLTTVRVCGHPQRLMWQHHLPRAVTLCSSLIGQDNREGLSKNT